MNIVRESQKLQKLIICPVSQQPLSEAVTLVPCACKVQQAAAVAFHGEVSNNGWQTAEVKPCTVCGQSVMGYLKDQNTRDFVQQLQHLSPESIKQALKDAKDELRRQIKIANGELSAPTPYPGEKEVFECVRGSWNVMSDFSRSSDSEYTTIINEIEFKSTNTEPFIEGVVITQTDRGYLSICITFSEEIDETLSNHLRSIGCYQGKDATHLQSNRLYSKLEDVDALFQMLTENGEIPEPYLTTLKESFKLNS